ncbi:MAG: hypothetical protein SFV51_26565 [Bryobacteraceae bacterium]|nr:hypothetical protein [Bryobacteraceae bacterium]
MANPYDRNFKVFGEDDVRGMMYLFAGIPLTDRVSITPIDKDLAVPGLLVDNAQIIRHRGRRFILHLEAELFWHDGIPRDIGRYAQALDLKYELPVRSVLVLLTPRGCPKRLPKDYRYRRGGLDFRHRYETVPVWKLPAENYVRLARPSLQPWVLLMRPSDRQAQRAADLVTTSGDKDLMAQFLALGRLNSRYDKAKLLEFLGRLQPMILRDDILEQSDFVQYFKKKGLDQGREEGREEGRAEGALCLLRLLLRERFKGLETRPELNRLTDPAEIERLAKKLLAAKDRESALGILRRL